MNVVKIVPVSRPRNFRGLKTYPLLSQVAKQCHAIIMPSNNTLSPGSRDFFTKEKVGVVLWCFQMVGTSSRSSSFRWIWKSWLQLRIVRVGRFFLVRCDYSGWLPVLVALATRPVLVAPVMAGAPVATSRGRALVLQLQFGVYSKIMVCSVTTIILSQNGASIELVSGKTSHEGVPIGTSF